MSKFKEEVMIEHRGDFPSIVVSLRNDTEQLGKLEAGLANIDDVSVVGRSCEKGWSGLVLDVGDEFALILPRQFSVRLTALRACEVVGDGNGSWVWANFPKKDIDSQALIDLRRYRYPSPWFRSHSFIGSVAMQPDGQGVLVSTLLEKSGVDGDKSRTHWSFVRRTEEITIDDLPRTWKDGLQATLRLEGLFGDPQQAAVG